MNRQDQSDQLDALKGDLGLFVATNRKQVLDSLKESWPQRLIHLVREVDNATYERWAGSMIKQEVQRLKEEEFPKPPKN